MSYSNGKYQFYLMIETSFGIYESLIANRMITSFLYKVIDYILQLLTAVSHNLRGCLVDFIDIKKINKILNLPDHITCQVLVPIGYPDKTPNKKDIYNKKERIFYNKWGKSGSS
ncbi:nitroreductase family protein [Halanaerobium saccharolyticum]|uniref:Nitroreductase family protein n=1 Tax=Halanaerobium saccharolyticum TaxID=43595 RepID=A0A4R7ZAK1_9FIRM|nr:nitroreductase family protein [Halanaerobium saccharolyticum]TDW07085.1 nitroreductase family protein [Halanaerobium saccharolyticum]TDX63850.1 nitroreductase family protein [Halanaerobium saccharolyticum]